MSNITINVDNDYMLGRMNGKTLHLVMIEQQQEIERLKRIIKIKDGWLSLVRDIGFDYDGYNKAEDLKKLIDELVEYSIRAIKNDDTSVAYIGYEKGKEIKENILMEELGSDKE